MSDHTEITKWKDIRTAPKDGTVIIGFGFDRKPKTNDKYPDILAAAMIYHNGLWWQDNHGTGWTVACYPTKWIDYPDDF